MIKTRYAIPGLLVGVALLGGGTAYAFGPGGFDMDAFASFTQEEQSAIQKAHDIRESALKEAEAVLAKAGVTKEEMHDAMKAYHQEHKQAMDDALDANDYEAFVALMADTPMAENITEATFSKLVEIRSLEKSGDKEGAQELRKELRDEVGFGGLMGMGHGGHKGGMMDGDEDDAQ